MAVLGSIISEIMGPVTEGILPSGAAPDSLLTDLVSWWGLDQSSGTRWDSHGSNHLLESDPPLGQAGGKVNKALLLDDSASPDQYLHHPAGHGCHAGPRDFTFVCWAYLQNITLNHGIARVGIGPLGENHDWLLYYQASGLDRFRFYVPNGTAFWSTTANTFGLPVINTWYFFIGQYDFSTGTMGISINNGTLDVLAGKSSPNTTGRDFEIGRFGTSQILDGREDEAAFWSRLLTSDEKARLYNSGAGISYPGTN